MMLREFLEFLWVIINSPAGITVLGALLLALLNRLYARRPLWQQFEGSVIAAVKLAEKTIPDDSPNKAMRRLDEALRTVLQVFEETQRRRASAAEAAELKEGVQIVHAKLESQNAL